MNTPVLFSTGMLGYQSFARVHGICVLPSCFTEVECLLQYFTEVSRSIYTGYDSPALTTTGCIPIVHSAI